MWKKILYYGISLTLGVMFAVTLYYGMVASRFESIVNNAIKDREYVEIAQIFSHYNNAQEVYLDEQENGTIVVIFETGAVEEIVVYEDQSPIAQMDMYYSIFVLNSNIDSSTTQDDKGNAINETGFTLKSSDKECTYNVLEAKKFDEYKDLFIEAVGLDMIQIQIPSEYVVEELGKDQVIENIIVSNADGSEYLNLDVNFAYSSDFFLEISELKVEHNKAAIADTDEAIEKFSVFFEEWKADFYKQPTFLSGYTLDQIYPTSFYVKLASGIVAYFVVVFILGDFIVGKKRILSLFNKITKK